MSNGELRMLKTKGLLLLRKGYRAPVRRASRFPYTPPLTLLSQKEWSFRMRTPAFADWAERDKEAPEGQTFGLASRCKPARGYLP